MEWKRKQPCNEWIRFNWKKNILKYYRKWQYKLKLNYTFVHKTIVNSNKIGIRWLHVKITIKRSAINDKYCVRDILRLRADNEINIYDSKSTKSPWKKKNRRKSCICTKREIESYLKNSEMGAKEPERCDNEEEQNGNKRKHKANTQ